MAISSDLNKAILEALNVSPMTLSRRAKRLAQEHGPMSGDEARWVIAHDSGLDLRRYGLGQVQLDRVRQLRAGIQAPQPRVEGRGGARRTAIGRPAAAPGTAATPAAMFNSREFHPAVARSSRRLFVDGHRTEAIHRAFQRVNNRVRRLAGISDKDGQALMGEAFKDSDPALQINGRAGTSERDEHAGVRLLMMGAMTGLRNPRAHEDRWEPDNDVESVLDSLSLASLLHRFLDRCEAYRQANP